MQSRDIIHEVCSAVIGRTLIELGFGQDGTMDLMIHAGKKEYKIKASSASIDGKPVRRIFTEINKNLK